MACEKLLGKITYPLNPWNTKQIFVGIRCNLSFDIVIGLRKDNHTAIELTLQQFELLQSVWKDITDYLCSEGESVHLPLISLGRELHIINSQMFESKSVAFENPTTKQAFFFTRPLWKEISLLLPVFQGCFEKKMYERHNLISCVREARNFVQNMGDTVSREDAITHFPLEFLKKSPPCRVVHELLTYAYEENKAWIFT